MQQQKYIQTIYSLFYYMSIATCVNIFFSIGVTIVQHYMKSYDIMELIVLPIQTFYANWFFIPVSNLHCGIDICR